jgi:hypothetical protein
MCPFLLIPEGELWGKHADRKTCRNGKLQGDEEKKDRTLPQKTATAVFVPEFKVPRLARSQRAQQTVLVTKIAVRQRTIQVRCVAERPWLMWSLMADPLRRQRPS